MTRLGLIARADDTGLGVQTREFFRHMPISRCLVLDFCEESPKPLKLHEEWYPGATIHKGIPHQPEIDKFLDGLDVVFTAETFYNPEFITAAKEKGVRTVVQPNWEFYVPTGPQPDVLAMPTTWHFEQIAHPGKIHLPVPIAHDRWVPGKATTRITNFLHIVGHPAVHDRNGTQDLVYALPLVKSEVVVTMRCQDPGFLASVAGHTPDNVTLIIESSHQENYWDNYVGQQVLVMPRRYGGVCLPAQEAIGAGMPVIMPDISPNNDWLPNAWLTPAVHDGKFQVAGVIDKYLTRPHHLARMIDLFATDPDFAMRSIQAACALAHEMSWEVLRPRYEEVLFG